MHGTHSCLLTLWEVLLIAQIFPTPFLEYYFSQRSCHCKPLEREFSLSPPSFHATSLLPKQSRPALQGCRKIALWAEGCMQRYGVESCGCVGKEGRLLEAGNMCLVGGSHFISGLATPLQGRAKQKHASDLCLTFKTDSDIWGWIIHLNCNIPFPGLGSLTAPMIPNRG